MSQDERNNRDEVLIDYMELEIEAPLKKDLDILLESSVEDRRHLESLRLTRAAISLAAGDVNIDDARMEALSSQIMNNLDRKLDDNIFILPSRRRFVPVAAAVALVLLGSLILWNLRRQGTLGKNSSDALVSASASNLEEFTDSLINSESDSDFFIEVAARKMESMSLNESEIIFDQLKE